jgi:ribosomal protein S18 acetylase RimI-like enzyme
VTQLEIRPPREDEAEPIAELFNEISTAGYGVADTTEGEVRLWLTAPGVDREKDVRIAVGSNGRLYAYGDVWEQGGKAWLDIRERSTIGDGAAAKEILDALLPRTRELIPDPAVVRSWVPSIERAIKAMFEREGFALVRHSVQMAIDLVGDLPGPEWPPEITVRTFEPGRDERMVYETQNEGFSDMWEYTPDPYEEWLHFMTGAEDFDPTLWFLATAEDEVAGVCLCRPQRPGEPDVGWVRVLCVRPRWRRRGIALALLRHAFGELAQRGRLRAGLGVDAASTTGALELYERAGMRVVRQADIYERVL